MNTIDSVASQMKDLRSAVEAGTSLSVLFTDYSETDDLKMDSMR